MFERSRLTHCAALALGAAALLAGTPAHAQVGGFRMQMAQQLGFYAGAGGGRSKGQDACDTTGVAFVGSCDDKNTTWNVFAGYKFHPNIGAELGFVRLGKLDANGTVAGAPFSATEKVKGFELVAVGAWPIYQALSAYAKAGIFHWDSDTNSSVLGPMSKRGTDFTFGVGLQYNFTPTLAARAELQRYNKVNDTSYDVARASVLYTFY
jgi:OOP family OmpA-OmpF porin